MTLTALEADIHNVLGTDAKVETRQGAPNIGHWTDPRAWAGWRFRVDRPGRFDVVAELAAPQAGSRFRIAAGGQTLAAEAPATGDYGKYQKVTLGQLTVELAGEVELAIRPDARGWKPINLRSVTLKPTER